MRHFVNKMPDFASGSRVHIDVKYWKEIIDSMINVITSKMPATVDNSDGGLYVGCAGVAYMFYCLANSDIYADARTEMLTKARSYLDVAMTYAHSRHNRGQPTAFLLGNAGVYAVRSLVLRATGHSKEAEELSKQYLAMSATVQPINYLPNGSDELFVGRAGYLCGALLLNRASNSEVVTTEAIDKVCASIIQSGQSYAKKHKSSSPLMYHYHQTEYLGAAHGLASIVQMLLSFPSSIKAYSPLLRETVDFMLRLMQPDGNIAPAMDEVLGGQRRSKDNELVHWCHGTPGAVYMFARAFFIWREERYLDACLRCGELVWHKGLLRKGPGICHGVSGSGYVFLLLYRLTSDEKHLHRALKFAEFMQSSEFTKARTPDSPYSLFEGLAGSVCFLTDLLQPKRAEFPFFNVFF